MDNKKADLNDGYTRIANKLMQAIYKCSILTGRDARVLMFIIYQTYGYNHKERALSYTYISEGVGIAPKHICRIVKKLVDAKIVKKSFKNGVKSQVLGINTRVSEWRDIPTGGIPKEGNSAIPILGECDIPKEGNKNNTDKNNTECVGENGVCRFPVTQIFDRLWSEWRYSQAGKDRVPRKVRLEIESIGYMKMNDARLRYEDDLENRQTKNNQALSARTWFNGAYRPYLPEVAENGLWKNIKGEVYFEEELLE